jgi:hypothetical protein
MSSTSPPGDAATPAPTSTAQAAGAPPADGALDRHIRFFDIDGDGRITVAEIHEGMLEMGFSKLTATVVAPVLGAALPAKVSDIAQVRHPDSASFTSGGRFDDAAFERWFAATDTDGSGGLTRFELLKSTLALADGPMTFLASTGEFQLMYTIVARDGQAPKEALRDFFSGAFFDKIIAKRKAAAAGR